MDDQENTNVNEEKKVEELETKLEGMTQEEAPPPKSEEPLVQNQPEAPAVAPQPASPQPSLSEEKLTGEGGKSKVVLSIAIIFFVLSLIGLVAYLVGAFKEGRISFGGKATPTPLATVYPEETVLAEASPIAGEWVTYENEYYTLEYPSDFGSYEEGDLFTLSKLGPTQTEDTEIFDGISLGFTIQESLGKSLSNYVNEKVLEVKDAGISEVSKGPTPVTLNGYSGQTYTEEGLGTFVITILESPNKEVFLEISEMTADPGNLGFLSLVEEILETLEFVSPSETATPSSGFDL